LVELGYLASPMAFSGDTEEIVLTINGMKKVLYLVTTIRCPVD
jgi:AP-3 complex subunit delta-1